MNEHRRHRACAHWEMNAFRPGDAAGHLRSAPAQPSIFGNSASGIQDALEPTAE